MKPSTLLVPFLLLAFWSRLGVERVQADEFRAQVQPYLKTYCEKCHNPKLAKGELDFSVYRSEVNVTAHFRRWNNIIAFIKSGEMPPEKEPQPGIAESNAVVAAIEAILLKEARRNAGDPGVILPRRLSNTEYDLSIEHLTGVAIQPTRTFPVDPAGGEGFDNTGEALSMSPSLLKKYLGAAQQVASHMVLTTAGISFAPYPVTSYNERKKLTEQAIIDFYADHKVDTLAYLTAAWRYRFRGAQHQKMSVAEWAASAGLSGKYLTLVWQTLSTAERSTADEKSGFLKQLGEAWLSLPAPKSRTDRPAELLAFAGTIEFGRRLLTPRLQGLIKSNAGNWPIQWLQFRSNVASQRDQYAASNLRSEVLLTTGTVRSPDAKKPQPYSVFVRFDRGFGDQDGYVILKRPIFSRAQKLPKNQKEEKESHQVQSLRSVLEMHHPDLVEQLGFGTHPAVNADGNLTPEDATVHLPFDEGEGDIVGDVASKERQGKVYGPVSWQPGKTGTALATSGESYVDAGNTANFNRQEPFSFGCWIKPTGEASGAPLGKMSEEDENRGYFIDSSGGKLQVMLSHEWPENSIMVHTVEKIAPDQWQHVYVTYDGSSKASGVAVYVDGRAVQTAVISDTLVSDITTEAPLLIGRRYLGPKGSPFHGLIDDVRLFNRTLSAEEVAALADVGPVALDREWLVVKTPAVIEIPITVAMQRELQGKHLLWLCQLDPKYSKDASVLVQHGSGSLPENRLDRMPAHLMYGTSAAAQRLARSGNIFSQTFPNRFFYVDEKRGLAAGFHLVEGFFRDDQPLVSKVLTDDEVEQLDRLWRELDFVTQSTETLLRGFVWFERSERHVLHDKRFDFLRAEDPELVQAGLLGRFERLYLDKLGTPAKVGSFQPVKPSDKFNMVHGFFEDIRKGLRTQTETLARVEPIGLADVEQFASRAYRRSLTSVERRGLQTLYVQLREDGQAVEERLRGLITAILLSPDFCYRFNDTPAGDGVYPIGANDLASRLSYFLWSSIPDAPLLAVAAQGGLQDSETLVAELRRMCKDDRIQAFAREFFGQWLRYRDYLSKDPIDAAAFPGYDDVLRESMFQEPTRLATWLIQQDRPVTDLLTSDQTFVNGRLADHYGGVIADQYRVARGAWLQQGNVARTRVNDMHHVWFPVTGLQKAGRGGLFGMGVLLAKNSAGQRTSPVKRGFWAVHHLLGQHFPPPPADVAELPDNEKESTDTIRKLLAAHVSDPRCAMCHTHFDSIGLAMEGFDPIGRARSQDLAGRPIDNRSELPDGTTATGIPQLIEYIGAQRKEDFVKTLCRKFLGYALGRSVALTDQPLLHEMQEQLAQNEYRFSALFETVVVSPQFRRQRGRDFVSRRR
ncbi:MAG TPA: hypothetical protein DCE55_02845 [Planctomycetaceae bacterium]|nr:hypothetical protein [Planctomycetaceae bacterium]|tara:strand:- start:13814 stop:17893 length:4080 start_codon:yes stop_codon:yes gene_type:complete